MRRTQPLVDKRPKHHAARVDSPRDSPYTAPTQAAG